MGAPQLKATPTRGFRSPIPFRPVLQSLTLPSDSVMSQPTLRSVSILSAFTNAPWPCLLGLSMGALRNLESAWTSFAFKT